MLVSVAREVGFDSLWGTNDLKKIPVDLLRATNQSLTYLSLQENLPKEDRPTRWQFLFDDELKIVIDRWLEKMRGDKTEEDSYGVENVYAKDFLQKVKGG